MVLENWADTALQTDFPNATAHHEDREKPTDPIRMEGLVA
jgi:hypothetical protein